MTTSTRDTHDILSMRDRSLRKALIGLAAGEDPAHKIKSRKT